MTWLAALPGRLLHREVIHGGNPGHVHFVRWQLARWGDRAIYVHRFLGSDRNRDLHDHPKHFVSIGLWGSYIEEVPTDVAWVRRQVTYRAPWIRTFPSTHRHRILRDHGRPCWTLVLTGKTVRPWGFWVGNSWVPWQDYVARNPGAGRDGLVFGAESTGEGN